MALEPVIIVHGGAGLLRGNENLVAYSEGLKQAATKGFDALSRGASSLDAVVAAVSYMEECGAFNAGAGCCLTYDGRAEVDAGVMNGDDLSVGAVASLTSIRHPVLAARMIMDLTDHVLLVGEGAMDLLGKLGVKQDPSLVTQDKLARLAAIKERSRESGGRLLKNANLMRSLGHDTVGALAIDTRGGISAGVSTGGYWLKLSGRVGDSPLAGAGFYADSRFGGCVATGTGELAIRTCLSKTVVDAMAQGASAQEACELGVKLVTERFGTGNMGLIALDSKGGVGFDYNTEGMGVASMSQAASTPFLHVFRENPR
ncbi:MAG: isoaspartyl peptidase/L-asparaginase [Candidatus Marsarchaeota archaeon]|nr:isoaspartyl peptidase/L-asparaginase [Candidatus Marsarchaeota archaeon]